MERVRLRIETDGPAGPRVAGDVVDGRVLVEVDEDVTCRAVNVWAGWTTEDRTTGPSGAGTVTGLPGGPWRGGDRLVLPFRVSVPEGPPTYEGKRLDVRWFLRAEAVLAWARDPSATAPLLVAGRPPARGEELHELTETGCFDVGCAGSLVAVPAAAAAVLLLGRPPLAVRVVCMVVGGAAALGAMYGVPRAIAGRRLGTARIEVGPVPVRRGSELACRVVLSPRRAMEARPLRAVLAAKERSFHGTGKRRSARTEVVAREEVVLHGPAALVPGREAEFAGMIPVPVAAGPTFDVGGTGVTCTLTLTADVPGLPDVEWTVNVPVV